MDICINNMNIHYHVSGQGKNVILLHGWGGSIKSFEPVHKNLEKDFTVYSLDLPGFGKSQEPAEPWGAEEYADTVEKFIKELAIDKPILVGHSHGGKTSILVAAGKRVELNKVILVDSAGIKPKRSFNYYARVYFFKACKNLFKLPFLNKYSDQVIESMRKKFGSSDYKNASGVMRQTLVKLVNTDVRHLLPEIRVSTLLIWGDKDTATPLSDGQLMEKLIPDAGLVVLKNCGHFSYLEKLQEFLIIIREFLRKDMVQKHD